jgi:glutaredoxin 3
MTKVEIYTTRTCPFCIRAKQLLDSKQVRYQEYPVDNDPELRKKMTERAGGLTSVPQIFINGIHKGGCDDLFALQANGELDRLLNNDGNGNGGPGPA